MANMQPIKNKKQANILAEEWQELLPDRVALIHSNKTQNYRLRAVKNFENGKYNILIATDIIDRGLDLTDVSHVVNFDIPKEPENYMHRIGRTGRAKQEGTSISFFTEEEADYLSEIEQLMGTEITVYDLPETIEISTRLIDEEIPKSQEEKQSKKRATIEGRGEAFHEKKEKNRKVNRGGSYRREITKKYKKPKTRGQKKN